MKMANIDAVFDFMFTSPKEADGVSNNNNLLTFIGRIYKTY